MCFTTYKYIFNFNLPLSIYVITLQHNLRWLSNIIFSVYVNLLKDIFITIWLSMYVSIWEFMKNILYME